MVIDMASCGTALQTRALTRTHTQMPVAVCACGPLCSVSDAGENV